MMHVYFDHNASTPLDPRVLEVMLPFLHEQCGNASSRHEFGTVARKAVDRAREQVAAIVGAQPAQVVFTSGGTESDNLAVLGAWRVLRTQGKRAVVTSPTEHKAVLVAAHQAAKEGAEERLLHIDATGRIDLADAAATIGSM